MPAGTVRRRPGGRSARTRESVLEAVLEMCGESGWPDLSIPMVAERAGVHPSTVYRRWGSLRGLIGDALQQHLAASAPIPDTGSLREDLDAYALQLAANLSGAGREVLLRAMLLADVSPSAGLSSAPTFLARRRAELEAMLRRAADRGERTLSVQELFEGLIAPMYGYTLLFPDVVDPDLARHLLGRLLAHRTAAE